MAYFLYGGAERFDGDEFRSVPRKTAKFRDGQGGKLGALSPCSCGAPAIGGEIVPQGGGRRACSAVAAVNLSTAAMRMAGHGACARQSGREGTSAGRKRQKKRGDMPSGRYILSPFEKKGGAVFHCRRRAAPPCFPLDARPPQSYARRNIRMFRNVRAYLDRKAKRTFWHVLDSVVARCG